MLSLRRAITIETPGLLAAATLLAGAATADAATMRRDWAGARQMVVVCRAAAENSGAALKLCEAVGRSVADQAGRGAPLPVTVARFGDPQMFAADSVVLLVTARSEGTGEAQTLSFGLRPWRAIAGDDNDLFGTAPRAVRAPAGAAAPEMTAAIDAALDEVLPWRKRRLTR